MDPGLASLMRVFKAGRHMKRWEKLVFMLVIVIGATCIGLLFYSISRE